MKKLLSILGAVGILLSAFAPARADVLNMGGVRDPATGTWTGLASVEFVSVGDAGNAADPDTGYGKVDYAYKIGTFDVTAAQYNAFLNSVAKVSDPYGLYNANMNTAAANKGCNIIRSGTAGNYSYTVAADWANRPVNYVSWGSAARFCNWLQNGQKTGNQNATTTESGAYALNGAITDAALMAVTRNGNAQYFIPNQNEWYKAAYYDPNKSGAGQAGYWLLPTRHDTPAINILDATGTNNANFYDILETGTKGLTIGSPYFRTEVGAFAASPSPYGTYDQCGNLEQWTETISGLQTMRIRGGSFIETGAASLKWDFSAGYPSQGIYALGFRIGSIDVPEPCIFVLLLAIVASGLIQWICCKRE
ncbi:MAG: SUMF1/EgtB/PvdO family nonheme iron enzyme [Pirellulales bacterium]|nr:SUMF1/EgtB/PvdO family nonheme iron enzyme [Pirellulales bacterium]